MVFLPYRGSTCAIFAGCSAAPVRDTQTIVRKLTAKDQKIRPTGPTCRKQWSIFYKLLLRKGLWCPLWAAVPERDSGQEGLRDSGTFGERTVGPLSGGFAVHRQKLPGYADFLCCKDRKGAGDPTGARPEAGKKTRLFCPPGGKKLSVFRVFRSLRSD